MVMWLSRHLRPPIVPSNCTIGTAQVFRWRHVARDARCRTGRTVHRCTHGVHRLHVLRFVRARVVPRSSTVGDGLFPSHVAVGGYERTVHSGAQLWRDDARRRLRLRVRAHVLPTGEHERTVNSSAQLRQTPVCDRDVLTCCRVAGSRELYTAALSCREMTPVLGDRE